MLFINKRTYYFDGFSGAIRCILSKFSIDWKLLPISVKPFGKWRILMFTSLLGLLFTACADQNNNENTNGIETKPVEQKLATKYLVEIKGMKYNPQITHANLGDTVLFVNKDLVPHTVTDTATSDSLSPLLNTNDQWYMLVTKNLHFYCSVHPVMKGAIVMNK